MMGSIVQPRKENTVYPLAAHFQLQESSRISQSFYGEIKFNHYISFGGFTSQPPICSAEIVSLDIPTNSSFSEIDVNNSTFQKILSRGKNMSWKNIIHQGVAF